MNRGRKLPKVLPEQTKIEAKTTLPKVKFTRWLRWKERDKIPDSNKPGVYALAKFNHRPPPGSADPLDKNIIYFGETCRQSLRARWNQFNRSAFKGKAGHAGGKNYRETYGDNGLDLYVAACPVSIPDEALRSSFIRFLERKIILDYVREWRTRPECNLK